jgi:tetratricopeptide (TPR) repeat protein
LRPSVRSPLRVVVAALMALLPILLGAGLLLSALWWLTLAWMYLGRSERVMAAVAALGSALMPVLVWVAGPALGSKTGVVDSVYVALLDVGRADEARKRLEAAEPSALTLGVAGLVHKRLGRLEDARTAMEAALKNGKNMPWLYNNLGCVYAGLGALDRAQAQFERAAEIDPRFVVALHNAAMLHNEAERTGSAQEAWRAAENVDAELAQAYRDRTAAPLPRPHNIAVIDARPPSSMLWELAMRESSTGDRVSAEIWSGFCPWLPRQLYPAALGGFLVVWVLLSLLGRRLRPSSACVRCGAPACPRCDAGQEDRTHCGPCYNVFQVRGAKVEAALKLQKDVQIRRYRLRQQLLTRLLSVIMPGAGQVFAGHTARGALFMVMFGVLLGVTLGVTTWIPDPSELGHRVAAARALLVGVPMGVVYLVSLVLSLREET